MLMLGTVNIPYSKIEEDIENICVEYGHGGYDVMTCDESAVDEILKYFNNLPRTLQWNLSCAVWPNEEGGSCHISWIEEGHLCGYGFNYLMED